MTTGSGVDRMARRMLTEARALDVPEIAEETEITPPLDFARACGFEPDEWQADVLTSDSRKRLLNVTRQGGKSTTTALGALHEAVYMPGALVLLLSPSQRQSGELFRKVTELYDTCALPLPAIAQQSALRLELDNGSRVIALPGSEATTRGYSAATRVVVDEAARVPDSLIAAVRPSLATTNGRMIALSTPAGKRGWFHEQWTRGEGWDRTEVKAADCPRISAEFLEDERRQLGEFVYRQEYECEFLDAETAVFASELIEHALSGGFAPLWPAGSEAWRL